MAAKKAADEAADVVDIDAELAADEAAVEVPNVQADGTVWFAVGVGEINVTVGSVVYDRLIADGLQPIPAPEG